MSGSSYAGTGWAQVGGSSRAAILSVNEIGFDWVRLTDRPRCSKITEMTPASTAHAVALGMHHDQWYGSPCTKTYGLWLLRQCHDSFTMIVSVFSRRWNGRTRTIVTGRRGPLRAYSTVASPSVSTPSPSTSSCLMTFSQILIALSSPQLTTSPPSPSQVSTPRTTPS